jgi:hypothetical protein
MRQTSDRSRTRSSGDDRDRPNRTPARVSVRGWPDPRVIRGWLAGPEPERRWRTVAGRLVQIRWLPFGEASAAFLPVPRLPPHDRFVPLMDRNRGRGDGPASWGLMSVWTPATGHSSDFPLLLWSPRISASPARPINTGHFAAPAVCQAHRSPSSEGLGYVPLATDQPRCQLSGAGKGLLPGPPRRGLCSCRRPPLRPRRLARGPHDRGDSAGLLPRSFRRCWRRRVARRFSTRGARPTPPPDRTGVATPRGTRLHGSVTQGTAAGKSIYEHIPSREGSPRTARSFTCRFTPPGDLPWPRIHSPPASRLRLADLTQRRPSLIATWPATPG